MKVGPSFATFEAVRAGAKQRGCRRHCLCVLSTGQLWVEASPTENIDEQPNRPARAGDGVSSILITSNDMAGAWAIRPDGQAMLPIGTEPRQREFAFRAGVNIVMYTLTGNYKADQVHIPALLERLGQ